MGQPPFTMSKYATLEDLYKDKADYYQAKYEELIMSVEKKYPDETRHETALRYIKFMELPTGEACSKTV
jgi:hypothetical protein